jgi:DNA-binding protein HU-beta
MRAIMNRADLISAIAEKLENVTKKQTQHFLESFLEILMKTIKAGDKLTLVDFGTFGIKNRAARNARNPRTGEAIKIPATRVPYFSAGKALKTAVKSNKTGKKAKK